MNRARREELIAQLRKIKHEILNNDYYANPMLVMTNPVLPMIDEAMMMLGEHGERIQQDYQ